MNRYQLSTNNYQLPKGYKQTEVGVIPEDWKLVRVGELEPFVTSGSRGWARYYSKFGAPFIRITNLRRESIYLDLSDLKVVDLPKGVSEGKRTELFNGDLLISITADIGMIGYVDDSIPKPAYINQHISLVRFDSKKSDSKFISYFLASESVQRLFRGATDQGAKAGLNLDTIRSLKFTFPPLCEQKSLAQALSDVDALIASLDKLIAKQRHLKTATMQQLLTGKKRLPGFGEGKEYQQTEIGVIPEDWMIRRLIDVVDYVDYRGKTPPKQESGMILVTARNIREGFIDYESSQEYVSEAEYDKIMRRGKPKIGDVLITTEAPLGNVAAVDNENIALAQRVIKYRAKNKDLNQDYLKYYLLSEKFQRILQDNSSGSTAQGIKGSLLHTLPIIITTEKEQNAIATVLSDMDAAIAALESRLVKTQALKQGMMQQLLTGKIRLKIDA